MAHSILTGLPTKSAAQTPAAQARNPEADLTMFTLMHQKMAALQQALEARDQQILSLTQAMAVEQQNAARASGRADVAERALAAETRRADDGDVRYGSLRSEMESLRGSYQEASASAAMTSAQAQMLREQMEKQAAAAAVPAPDVGTVPAPPKGIDGWTMTASRFDEFGNIIEMSLTPKGV